jgi:probable O-glycosylation ligase (exosortase A-associated)
MSSSNGHLTDYEPLTRPGRPRLAEADEADKTTRDESWRPSLRPAHDDAHAHAAAELALEDDAHAPDDGADDFGDGLRPAGGRARRQAPARPDHSFARRGHAVSYAGLFIFTVILYFRPYELIPALSSFTSMAFWVALLTLAAFLPSQLALEGNLTSRPREVGIVLLLVVAALVSMPLAIDRGKAWEVFNETFIKAVLMFVVMVNVTRTERRLRWLIYLGLTVCAVLALGALSDYRAGNLTVDGYRVAGRIGGLFGNPNEMAINLTMMVPLAVALMLATRNLAAKLVFGVTAALMSVAVVLTFSRGSFLGLAAGSALLAWRIRRRNRLFVMLAAVVVILTLAALAPGVYFNRLVSIFDHSRDAVGSASQRQNLLFLSIKVALANPIFGVGLGNFNIVSIRGLATHNAYTQVAAELGLAALALFVAFFVVPYRRLRRVERETAQGAPADARFYYLAVGLQASIVGYMVNAFFISSAYQWYTFYLVGYAICLRRIHEARTAADARTTGAARRDLDEEEEEGAHVPEASALAPG